jgi:hypothetical protein
LRVYRPVTDARLFDGELAQHYRTTFEQDSHSKEDELRTLFATDVDYYLELAEDSLFAARQSSAKDVRDACMKDAAYFRALAKRIERRSKTDKSER